MCSPLNDKDFVLLMTNGGTNQKMAATLLKHYPSLEGIVKEVFKQ